MSGLSAGEQPAVGDRAPEVEAMASSGGRSSSADSATVKPSAPAERPFQPDWKKGKK